MPDKNTINFKKTYAINGPAVLIGNEYLDLIIDNHGLHQIMEIINQN